MKTRQIILLFAVILVAGCTSIPSHYRSREHMQAAAVIHHAFSVVVDRFWATGQWPQSLEELGDPTILQFKGVPMGYDPVRIEFSLPPWYISDYSAVKQGWEDARREANQTQEAIASPEAGQAQPQR